MLKKTFEIAKVAPSVANSDIVFETALIQAKVLHALGLELEETGESEELISCFEQALNILAKAEQPQNLPYQSPSQTEASNLTTSIVSQLIKRYQQEGKTELVKALINDYGSTMSVNRPVAVTTPKIKTAAQDGQSVIKMKRMLKADRLVKSKFAKLKLIDPSQDLVQRD